uniref:Uncharacterized protein n=1 Tax=Plectus sambesii TaxID=2011161 RepID=A0A914VDK6_9BILA
ADRNSILERPEGALHPADDGSDEHRLRHQNSLPVYSDADGSSPSIFKSASGSAIPSSAAARAGGHRSGSVINSGATLAGQQEMQRTLLSSSSVPRRLPTTPQQFLAERNGVGSQSSSSIGGASSKNKSSSELPLHLASGSIKSDSKKKKK